MKSSPNKTVVTGTLRTYAPATDGFGGDIDIEVIKNESPDPDADFLKPEPGKIMRAFCGQAESSDAMSMVGRRVRAQLTFLGGPFGGRAVVQGLKAE